MSGIFHLIFSNHGLPQGTEIVKRETPDKGDYRNYDGERWGAQAEALFQV